MPKQRHKNRREARKGRLEVALENVFLILTGIYLFYSYRGLTMFKPTVPAGFVQNLLLAMLLAALARLLLPRPRGAHVWAGLLLVFVYVESFFSIEKNKLLFLAVLVMGLQGIDHRKILKTFVLVVGGTLAATILAGLGGSIDNLVYIRQDMRSCWGTAYPTDFSAAALFLSMAIWMAWPELPDWGMLAINLAPLLLAVFITDSRNGLLCGALLEIAVGYHWLETAVLSRRGQLKRLRRAVDVLVTVAMPLCAVATWLLVWRYARDPAGMAGINLAFSDRLRLSAEAFAQYGLSPFGVEINMHGGWGGSVFFNSAYNFVDSSYMHCLLRYGWVTLTVMIGAWVWQTRRALRGNNRRMALVMAVVAIHSVMEHHLPDAFHNILVVMPLAALAVAPEAQRRRDWRPQAALGAVAAVLLALGFVFLPGVMTWLRTVYGARGWQGGGENTWPVLGLNFALIAATAGAAWALYRLLLAALRNKKPALTAAATLLACLVTATGLWGWGNGVIDGAVEANAALVEADADALSRLEGVKLVSDVLPQVYRRRFSNVTPTVLGGDDLARLKGATVLTALRPERRVLFFRGFKFARISDAHAVYTANPEAVAALEAGGYEVLDYYPVRMQVDVAALASRNKLDTDERGALLSGPKKSLTKGPGDNLYAGQYAVEYSLFLPEGAKDGPGEVCHLQVAPVNGDVLADVAVSREAFDEGGNAVVTVPFTLGMDTEGLEFRVLAAKNRQLGVSAIAYGQVRP